MNKKLKCIVGDIIDINSSRKEILTQKFPNL